MGAVVKSGRVGVVGGGLGGLAAACTLAARGYEVLLLERNDWLGGKAASLEARGYRFDMGPTILLMPSVIERIFAEAGRDYRDELELIPLDPQWRSFYDDGSTLDLHRDDERTAAAVDDLAPGLGMGERYKKFMAFSQTLREISDRFYLGRPVGGLKDMFDASTAFQPGMLADVLRMRPWSTVGATVRSYVPEPRVAQMIDHFTQ
ncbi:MAG: phytoene desaturase family protein, partial [Isosphaeraceae bacterium]